MLLDGIFVTVGGMIHTNYDVSASVYAFYPDAAPTKRTSMLVIGICLALLSGVSLAFVIRKKREKKPGKEDMVSTPVETVPSNEKSELADKLKAIMEEKQLFRNKDLRAADVAAELCTNTTYLSACLNGELNTSFPAFVTGYRIRYAQELMRKDPTMFLSKVAEVSGFTNERTFLRAFKAVCGVTPSEWKQELPLHP